MEQEKQSLDKICIYIIFTTCKFLCNAQLKEAPTPPSKSSVLLLSCVSGALILFLFIMAYHWNGNGVCFCIKNENLCDQYLNKPHYRVRRTADTHVEHSREAVGTVCPEKLDAELIKLFIFDTSFRLGPKPTAPQTRSSSGSKSNEKKLL